MPAMPGLEITRLGTAQATDPLLALYRRAIAGIDDGLYSKAEKQLWGQWADTPERANRMLRQGVTLLATREGQLLGFGQIMPDYLINMLYVDPNAARQGVGSALVAVMERIARRHGAVSLYTRASHASRPLFQRAGFVPENRELIPAATGIRIARTVMVKDLRISRR